MVARATFADDLEFLKKHFSVDVLENEEGAKIICVGALQGRTMTSTASGDSGPSNGYINYKACEKGLVDPQINLVGGEDRIWISPEGGQYSVFFEPGAKMDFANWRTPPCIDTVPYDLTDSTDNSLTYRTTATLMNMSGFTFEFELMRHVVLNNRAEIGRSLSVNLPADIEAVSYDAFNKITNTSDQPWLAETGLIALWTSSMNPPGDDAVLIIPFKPGDESKLGSIVTADYFGALDDTRLVVSEELSLIFLRGDGDFRSKLGVSFARACSPIGSWNPESGTLTIVEYTLPESAPAGFTNNLWEQQEEPFAGDVVNAYNDGPNDSNEKLGGFFELETLSPALALAPGEGYTHTPRTTQLLGNRESLDKVVQSIFGTDLATIESAFKPLTS